MPRKAKRATKRKPAQTKKRRVEAPPKRKPPSYEKLFKAVLRILRSFEPTKHGKPREVDIERELVQALKYGLPKPYNEQVVYEKEIRGGRLDISIGGNQVGVELKVEPNKSELDRLVGQVNRYRKEFKRMAVLILYAGIGARAEVVQETVKEIKKRGGKKVEVIVKGYTSKK